MTPERDAQSICALARSLVAQRGINNNVLRLGNVLTLKVSGNVLTITRDAGS